MIYNDLLAQSDLSPANQRVNILLTNLVNFVTIPNNKKHSQEALNILGQNGVKLKLRSICQDAEFKLESDYCTHIINKCKQL
jgi:hypothetical protein